MYTWPVDSRVLPSVMLTLMAAFGLLFTPGGPMRLLNLLLRFWLGL